MCTVVVFKDTVESHPLVIAANRDEDPKREARMPGHLSHAVFAPQDMKRGGTWMGVNVHGVAVAITNRNYDIAPKGQYSRGQLVMDALASRCGDEALSLVMEMNPEAYSGFHLIIADAKQAYLVVNDGRHLTSQGFLPGMHVITSYGVHAGHSQRDHLIRSFIPPIIACCPSDLKSLLTFHGKDPEDGTCSHGDGVFMESRFSMIARLPAAQRAWDLHWREGRPCAGGEWHEETVPLLDKARQR
ncbi:MAG: hypothetical protein RLZZ324_1189 [Candidatus Parcubacteria bacterium]|jgi:hypothetical protein